MGRTNESARAITHSAFLGWSEQARRLERRIGWALWIGLFLLLLIQSP